MNKIGAQLLLQIILIFLNAFFAMTEIAVISLNGAKLKKMYENGDRKAGKLLKLVEEPAGFLFYNPDRDHAGRIFGQCFCSR